MSNAIKGIALAGAIAFTGGLAAGLTGAALFKVVAISVALGAVSYLLTDKPQTPGLSTSDNVRLTIREAAPYRNYVLGRRRVGGVEIMKDTRRAPDRDAPDNDGYLDWVLVLADHSCHAVERIYINSEEVLFDPNGDVLQESELPKGTDFSQVNLLPGTRRPANYDYGEQVDIQKRYRDHAHVEFRLDGVAEPFPSLHRYGAWQSSDKATGCALMYFRGLWDREVYPNGEPDIEVQLQGCNTIRDPRDGSVGYTDNAALCTAWLLQNFPNLNMRKINQQALIAAANVCDEPATWINDEGSTRTQPAYRVGAFIRLDEDIQQIMAEFAKAIGGAIHYSHDGGGWRIEPGRVRVATRTLNEEDLTGSVIVQPKVPIEQRSNTLYPHFVSPPHDWLLTSIPVVTNDGYVAEDSAELIESIDYHYVTSRGQAVRLANQYLREKRAETVITCRVMDFEIGMSLRCNEAIRLNYDPLGISNALFLITSWQPVLEGDGLEFELTLKQHDTTAYDPPSAHNAYRLSSPSVISLVDSRYVPLLRGLTALSGDEQLRVLRDGTVLSRIELKWTTANSPYAADVEITYRKSTEDLTRTLIVGFGNSAYINGVEDGETYLITARYRNSLGVKGEAVDLSHTVTGKTAPPSAPTFMEVRQVGNVMRGVIDAPTDRDVGGIVIKARRIEISDDPLNLPEITSNDDWEAADPVETISISPRQFNQVGRIDFDFAVDLAGRYRFAARFIDTSGNASPTQVSAASLFIRIDDHVTNLAYAPLWEGDVDKFVRFNGELLPIGAKRADRVTVEEWLTTFAGPQAVHATDPIASFTGDELVLPDQINANITRTHLGNKLPYRRASIAGFVPPTPGEVPASTIKGLSADGWPLLDTDLDEELAASQIAVDYRTKQSDAQGDYTVRENVQETETNIPLKRLIPVVKLLNPQGGAARIRSSVFNVRRV